MPQNLVEDLAAQYTTYKATELTFVDWIRLHPVVTVLALLIFGWLLTIMAVTMAVSYTHLIYVTVYYAEKGEQKLHHFKKSMDIGNGHGGIVSQLKYNNEMKLTDELGTSTKANAVVKDAGKADRKPVQQKQAVAGKDKSDRGDDLGVRTVQNKHNESEVTNDNVASGFFGLE